MVGIAPKMETGTPERLDELQHVCMRWLFELEKAD